MRFVHTADLHLGRFYRGELPQDIAEKRREELWLNFENTVKYCKDEDIELLLISGDLFEREYFTLFDINRLKDILNTLKNTEVFIIAGNHDYINKESLYNKVSFNENIHIFRDEKHIDIDRLNLRVHGISWRKDGDSYDSLEFSIREDYKNILLFHGTADGDSYFPVKKERLRNLNFDYIALGHIHLPQKVLDNCFYPGSPEGLNFKETGSHGFIYGELDDRLKVRFVESAIRKYNIIEAEITEDMTVTDIKTVIDEKLKGKEEDLNRIVLKGEYENILSLITALNLNDGYFYTETVSELKESIDIAKIYENNRNNIIGRFIDKMKDDKDSLEIGLKALLEAQNEN